MIETPFEISFIHFGNLHEFKKASKLNHMALKINSDDMTFQYGDTYWRDHFEDYLEKQGITSMWH